MSLSVTEDEIQTGILKAANPDEHAVCFMRTLDGLDVHLEDKLANKFTDITNGAKDAQARQKLEKLKKEIIPSALSRSNIFENTVDWKPGGIDPNHDSHVVYLKKFCTTFVDKLQNMIGLAYEKMRRERAAQSPLLKEVLLHSRFCIKKCLNFHGREDELDRAMEYVQSSSVQKTPLVIHANSGTGKTSIMAVIGDRAPSWLGAECVVALRFLGTTPATSDIRRTLLSVCHQINMVYSLTSLNEHVLDNPGKLYRYFADLLQEVSPRAAGKPLLILLDSIDQLTAADGAFSMSWLPLSCPPHVSIIISTLPKTYKILETTQQLLPNKKAYLPLPDLSPATVQEIASSSLQYRNRKLTDVQMEALLAAVARCPTPLFLKLMLDGAVTWKSYTPVNHNEMLTTSRDAILELLETLERKYGAVLMEYICSFIFCAKGISDVEMEDALSCSDEVLSSLYMFHDPPIQGVVRIPPLLWTRVRSSIDEYLVEREVDGKTVVDWYHRLFKQAVSIKYVGISRVQRFKCRNSLAQMYMAENGVQRTINLIHRNKIIENADRQVAPQPLISSNVRKLNQLPRLLITSAKFDDIKNHAKEEVFCNFQWLDTKLHGTGVQNIVHDFKILEHIDEELELMRDFFRLAVSALRKNTELLAQEITGRLSSEDMESRCPRIKTLIDEARQWILQHERPILLPLFPCLTMPGGELKATIPGPTHLLYVVEDKIGTVWGKDLGLEIWDLEMNEMVCHIYQVVSPHDILFTADKSTLFHTEDTFVIGNSSKTGARNYHFDVLPEVSELGQKADVPNEGSFIKILAVHSDSQHIVVRINKPHMTKNLRGILLCDLDKNTSTPLDIEAVGKTITNAAFTRNTQKVVVTLDKMIYMCDFDGQVMFKTPLPSHLTSIPVSLFLTFDDTAGMFLGSLTDLVCISLDNLSIIYAQETLDQSQPCKIIDLYMLRNNRMLVVRYERRKKSAVLQWKKIDGSVETTRTSNTGQPKDLQVSQDETLGILGYSEIGYVEIWDLHAFCIIHTVQAHSRDVNRSVFNDFTGTLFTSSTEHLIKIWRLPQLVNVNKLGSKKQETNDQSNADGGESDITEDNIAAKATRGIKFKNTTQLLVDHEELDERLFDDSFSREADWGGSKTKSTDTGPDKDDSVSDGDGEGMNTVLEESQVNEKGVVMTIHQKRQHISCLVITNNGQIITSSETGPVVIWDAATGEEQRELHGSTGVQCVHTDGQGCHLIGLSIRDQAGDHGQYQLQMWNQDSGSPESWQDAPFAQSIVPVADHQMAVLQTLKGGSRILVLDLGTKEEILSATCKRSVKADFLRVTDDLMYALTVDPRKCVLVWSLQNTNETGFCTVKTVPVSCLPEAVTLVKGHKVITGTTYGHTLMWSLNEPPTSNVKKNKDIMLPGHHSREILDVFVSPDQRTVVSASADNTVIIRRVDEDYLLKIPEVQGQEVKVFKGHSDKVLCTYLSEDKKLLVSGSRDHTLRVWETETCKELCQFNANADTFQIHLGQDGRTVVALCHKFGARKLAMLKILHV